MASYKTDLLMPMPFSTTNFIDFLNQSPSPYHAADNMAQALKQAGVIELNETNIWAIEGNKSYFVTRSDGAICAWKMPSSPIQSMRMVGAHTDSPCLKVKPVPEMYQHGTLRLGVEVYGSALLSTWFDRGLSLAGRVVVKTGNEELQTLLIDFKKAIGIIPNLAIHLNRTANSQSSVNSQTDLPIILAVDAKDTTLNSLLLNQIAKQHSIAQDSEIMAVELLAYDTQPAEVLGINDDFVCGARMDNLVSCYVGLQSLINSDGKQFSLLICNDHEDVGSQSSSGAKGSFLNDVLLRIFESSQQLAQVIPKSLFMSVDNAHAIHPNYPQVHEENHRPLINAGPVIKINNNQSYATNALGASWVKLLASNANIPIQQFVVRSDMGCGSTIGPITATKMGINTVDIGVPQWAMHSIRETVGQQDCDSMYRLLKDFYNYDGSFDSK